MSIRQFDAASLRTSPASGTEPAQNPKTKLVMVSVAWFPSRELSGRLMEKSGEFRSGKNFTRFRSPFFFRSLPLALTFAARSNLLKLTNLKLQQHCNDFAFTKFTNHGKTKTKLKLKLLAQN
jgi:hypothetical protein